MTGNGHQYPEYDLLLASNSDRVDPDMEAAAAAQEPALYEPDYLKKGPGSGRSPIALVSRKLRKPPQPECGPRSFASQKSA
jgi:hypothetical protein